MSQHLPISLNLLAPAIHHETYWEEGQLEITALVGELCRDPHRLGVDRGEASWPHLGDAYG